MKPFPKILQEKYPCKPGCVPERPWWTAEPGSVCAIRVDGRQATREDFSEDYSMESTDTMFPIPHPGIRSLQAWANESGKIILVDLAGATQEELAEGGYVYLLADPICPWLAPWSAAE